MPLPPKSMRMRLVLLSGSIEPRLQLPAELLIAGNWTRSIDNQTPHRIHRDQSDSFRFSYDVRRLADHLRSQAGHTYFIVHGFRYTHRPDDYFDVSSIPFHDCHKDTVQITITDKLMMSIDVKIKKKKKENTKNFRDRSRFRIKSQHCFDRLVNCKWIRFLHANCCIGSVDGLDGQSTDRLVAQKLLFQREQSAIGWTQCRRPCGRFSCSSTKIRRNRRETCACSRSGRTVFSFGIGRRTARSIGRCLCRMSVLGSVKRLVFFPTLFHISQVFLF